MVTKLLRRPRRYDTTPSSSKLLRIYLVSFAAIQTRLPRCLSSSDTCLAEGAGACDNPNLRPMTVDVGYGPETFLAYVDPDVSTYYNETTGTRVALRPSFTGFAGKFVNLSPEKLRLFWGDGQSEGVYIGDANPFTPIGTATYIGHRFYFARKSRPNLPLVRFTILPQQCLYVYDPFDHTTYRSSPLTDKNEKRRLESLDAEQRDLYDMQKQNLVFAKSYREFTGREWLSLYGGRERPVHFMWNADYFGQTHFFQTLEKHFVALPSEKELGVMKGYGSQRRLKDDEPRTLQQYRAPGSTLSLTLKVLSCAPRVFEIPNFLSDIEADHILELAIGMKLKLSTTASGDGGQLREDRSTRTSRNTWVSRERSPIVDSIYRRASDVLCIDEALLRRRSADEHPELGTQSSIAEELQLVHYDVGEQYTPHHDWKDPGFSERQPARFATLLLYLNEGLEGGETSFPRWRNGETRGSLDVVPEKGKAVLFYSLLPDGNMDDLSEHAALPVKSGEKWLTNLWVWDPIKG